MTKKQSDHSAKMHTEAQEEVSLLRSKAEVEAIREKERQMDPIQTCHWLIEEANKRKDMRAEMALTYCILPKLEKAESAPEVARNEEKEFRDYVGELSEQAMNIIDLADSDKEEKFSTLTKALNPVIVLLYEETHRS